ncbi:MAG: site-specific recombinase [Bacteroidales bacterium]|nr:site-specific recombinase [Bacteroidales bacterium]
MAKRQNRMEEILRLIHNNPSTPNPELLVRLVEEIRPVHPKQVKTATQKFRKFNTLLQTNPEFIESFSVFIKAIYSKYDTVHLFVETGIMSLKGFTFELYNKIKHRILPTVEGEDDIRRLINKIFYKPTDYIWLNELPDELWEEMISKLGLLSHFKKQNKEDENFNRLISSIQILSHRISALGTESEITNKMPQLDEINSPFLQQNKEVTFYLDRFTESTDINNEDYKHILVILSQCEENLQQLRRNKHKYGTSLRITFLIRRLHQQIERLKTLLMLIHQKDTQRFCKTTVALFKYLVKSENQKNSIKRHLKENVDLLAYQVVEHAARTGIAYIARGRKEFWKFFIKSLKGGVIVAFFAITKILLSRLELSHFGYAFIQSLNYTMAFLMIYFTRSILATTQPAMTASTIVGSLEKKKDETNVIAMKRLAYMIVRVNRSQFISFVGNLLAALPFAILFSWLFSLVFSEKLAGLYKSTQMLDDLHPLTSGSFIYAAIAGIALFLAGLASGYYDNRVRYGEIPRRIAENRRLKKLLGQERVDKLSTYLGMNLGNISGYIALGVMFGSLSTIGEIFGIPLEFRHITFSAANLGISLYDLNFDLAFRVIYPLIITLMGIGFINFIVSFTLALTVAIKSRGITFRQSGKLFGLLVNIFKKYPMDYFFAPPGERPEEKALKKKINHKNNKNL